MAARSNALNRRRVSSVLRVMGLAHEKRFEKYHRVLNRAQWNSKTGAKILLGLLVALLPASFPILIAVDDTVERRSGKKLKPKVAIVMPVIRPKKWLLLALVSNGCV